MKDIVIIIAAIAYCILPDFFPGPIDDIIVALLSMGLVAKT